MSHRTLAALSPLLPNAQCCRIIAKLNVAARQKTVANLESRLRGEGSVLDFDADSLQNRLLRYFQSKLGFKNARRQLDLADEGRRNLLCHVEKAGLLGLHPGNKELHDLVRGFDNYDLHLLNTAVLAKNPSVQLKIPEIAEVITRKVKEGRGEDLIKYLAARLQHHQARMKSGTTKTLEVFNPVLVVLAWMWTEPSCPLWMMPSAAAIQVIADGIGTKLTYAAYNTMIRVHQLPRVPSVVLKKFMSVRRGDPECIRLRQEFEKAAGVSLDLVRPGRRSV